jgi:hypothetical protein
VIEDYQAVTVTIKPEAPKDEWQEPTGAGGQRRVSATYASSSRRITTQAGEQVVAAGVFGFQPGEAIGYNDRIVFEDREYRPIEIHRPRTLDGVVSTRVFVV